ncbi:histone H2A-Bbd type 1-like [Arvicola amphibius]|uniref:histone H2A-Bbd type 1-like n=1 Tax=Arvicola amphibius TaxID=1047088 RepID=UPI001C0A2D14|nr:histone H2A-Bbd type 1-like [Arvicola amphibius]
MRSRDEHLVAIKADVLRDPDQKRSGAEWNSSNGHSTLQTGTMEENRQKINISRSTRAQLNFPVSRIERFLREGNFSQRLSASAPVFLAGVLEYLTANVLDLSGKQAQARSRKRIIPEHVSWADESNKHLRKIFKVDSKSSFAETSKPDEN